MADTSERFIKGGQSIPMQGMINYSGIIYPGGGIKLLGDNLFRDTGMTKTSIVSTLEWTWD